jgi:penicillin-binding protein 2
MLVFDQLKKDDPRLRVLALLVLGGLGLLLGGLWWVQVVMARDYQTNLETQSFRTVRIPAVRGKILDRHGVVLAENRPTYNISLYLEELRKKFDAVYVREVTRARADLKQTAAEMEKSAGRRLTKEERKRFILSLRDKNTIRQKARFEVASNVVAEISQRLRQPLALDPARFDRHYSSRLALPYPVLEDISPQQIALFQEQSLSPIGVDLEIQSTRAYPMGSTAAHVLGRLHRDDSSAEGEESFFSYRLPDFRGVVGVEYGYDRALRGTAGAKSVLVNNIGYRQTENIWTPAEPGRNVVLTLDARIQRAAEQALQSVYGPATRGAVVVMDVRNGDILAMASSPTLNPNDFIRGLTRAEYERIVDLRAEPNRATQENYAPGSVFKMVVGMAALEAGLDPHRHFHVSPNPYQPNKGAIFIGRRLIKDTAPPGDYDFRRALKLSSNSYFITNGLRVGPERIVRLAERFHLGERTGLPTRQEVSGYFPDSQRVNANWTDGNTANLCIGQDPVLVTPLQVAVLTSAIANGGNVYWPRIVSHIEPPEGSPGAPPIQTLEQGRLRNQLHVKPRTLEVLHQAMLADVEDADGTGRAAAVPGLRICGKTGTAQIQDEANRKTGQTTWFASFAPFKEPRYAVVVMVEDGSSGGVTCAPVAGKIYATILECEKGLPPTGALALSEGGRP